MKILIIDDDKEFTETLAEVLRENYVVNLASTGEDGEFQLQDNEFDLIILDLSLSDTNGMVILKSIRKNGNETPVLILTGESGLKSKVDLLDLGADDYLTKPFKLAELEARIRALLRRKGRKMAPFVIYTKDLVLDTEKKIAKRGSRVLELRRKEYYILEYLMRNAGKVLSRSMILDYVWEDEPDALTNVVDVHIKYLRDRIDKPFGKKLIKTVHGLGYKIEA